MLIPAWPANSQLDVATQCGHLDGHYQGSAAKISSAHCVILYVISILSCGVMMDDMWYGILMHDEWMGDGYPDGEDQ